MQRERVDNRFLEIVRTREDINDHAYSLHRQFLEVKRGAREGCLGTAGRLNQARSITHAWRSRKHSEVVSSFLAYGTARSDDGRQPHRLLESLHRTRTPAGFRMRDNS